MSTPEEIAAAEASAKAAADAKAKETADAAAAEAASKTAADAANAAKAVADKKAADDAAAAKTNDEAAKQIDALKLAEGSALTQKRLDEIKALAKASKLNPEQTQALIRTEESAVVNHVAGMNAQADAQATAWVEELKKDPEIGGEQFGANVEAAKRVLEKYGSEKLRKALGPRADGGTGLGDHPELVRFIVNIAKASKEDSFFQAPPTNDKQPKSNMEVFYGDKAKK